MSEKKPFFKDYKTWICIIFAILCVVSLYGKTKVVINYNLSDYLPSTTDTAKALKIMEDEFGMTSNLQVMVTDIDVNDATAIKFELSAIEHVTVVNFDLNDEHYYKDGKALYYILVEGDEYEAEAASVRQAVTDFFNNEYPNYKVSLGGTIQEKGFLKEAMATQMPLIIAVSIGIALVILLITSSSWVEPFIFLASAGVAVLINLGSNALFENISYITKSIAAILQLALAMDYSIALLHTYRRERETTEDRDMAMKHAIKECFSPISASALTTIAGLLALLFMSFKIGFDIGVVLMKGIAISFVTAITLLPCMVIYLDKLILKTSKKPLVLPNKLVSKLPTTKVGKAIAAILGVALIVLAYIESSVLVTYTYNDSSDYNAEITETFGINNTILVMFKNLDDDESFAKQEEFIQKIQDYTTSDGRKILNNYTALTSTTNEAYDIQKAVQKVNISEETALQLFELYHLYSEPNSIKLTLNEFMTYANALVTSDPQAGSLVDSATATLIQRINAMYSVMSSKNTADGFYNGMTTGVMAGFTSIERNHILQLYADYEYDYGYVNRYIGFNDALNFLIYAAQNIESIKPMVSSDALNSMLTLQEGIANYAANEAMLEQELTPSEFQSKLASEYGVSMSLSQVNIIYGLVADQLGTTSETLPFIETLHYLSENGFIKTASTKTTIDNAYLMRKVYPLTKNAYQHDGFVSALSTIATTMGKSSPLQNNQMKQIYALYMLKNYRLSNVAITGADFVQYIKYIYSTDTIIQSFINTDTLNKLDDLMMLYNTLNTTESYNYEEITTQIANLQASMKSGISTGALGSDKISGVYVKYALEKGINNTDPIYVQDLLGFISDNMDTNVLLKGTISEDKKAKLKDAYDLIHKATTLLQSDNYTRILFNMNISCSDNESYTFADFISEEAKSVFGEETYVAGEIMSNNDLKLSFATDQVIINSITLISIFLIVLISFKSLSIPVLLTAVIEGSIWVMLCILGLANFNIFFMSYIVATCIIMGATIDYAILLTNSYMKCRMNLDKNESIIEAVKLALPTIFTSGSILTLCSLAIYMISTRNSIRTVGLLLCIGCLCSLFLILFVLPSLLVLLDKPVRALTIKKKAKAEKV